MSAQRIDIVDSHTEGEPTRVVIGGVPDLGPGTAAERLRRFERELDGLRTAVVCEPRGHDAMVGAWLLEPNDPEACGQVIFFNNVGMLGMCVHGTIGVAVTLAHLGRIRPGTHRIETPVGDVRFMLDDAGTVAVENVYSYRHATRVKVRTERYDTIVGDIAWGGNWFFLTSDYRDVVAPDRVDSLTDYCDDVRTSLRRADITGANDAEIDHVEVFGPPTREDADSKNFVLCPGSAFDRSPCGTGTSAKMACLAADGRLARGDEWRQESIIGSRFVGSYRPMTDGIVPTIRGQAFVTAQSTLLLDPRDPYRLGIHK